MGGLGALGRGAFGVATLPPVGLAGFIDDICVSLDVIELFKTTKYHVDALANVWSELFVG